jgi:predicted transcriptional regulator
MIKKDMFDVIIKRKPAGILILLLESDDGGYSCDLAKKLNYNYIHVSNTLKEMEINNLINLKKEGRTINATLTKKGKGIAKKLKNIKITLK